MDDIQKDGYIAGFMALIATIILILVGIRSNLADISGQFIVVLGVIFGGLTVGSFLRPNTVGQIVMEIFNRMFQNVNKNTSETTTNEKTTVVQKFGDVYGNVNTQAGTKDSKISKNVSKPKVKKK